MIKLERMKVSAQKQIAQNIFELTLSGNLVQEMGGPGQFVHLRVSDSFEPLLRRPISISSINRDAGQFTMIYRAEGKGTSLLSLKNPGEEVDVLGPLGNGFPVEEASPGEKVMLIGGGIGVPPLYELSKRLIKKGARPVHVLGFQSKEAVFYEEKFKELGDTYIVTVDGSHGDEGFVTQVLERLEDDFSLYYTCGPVPMLKAIQHMYPDKKGFLSFEERMGCGIGACFACVCKTTEQVEADYVKVCSDGPVFPAGVVSV